MKLTPVERWILSNQYQLLAHVADEHERASYERRAEALRCGYELEYKWMSEHIYQGDDTMSERECTEVIDTMDMWNTLWESYQQLGDKGGISESAVKFLGWDGNNEGKFMAYARHFCGDDDRDSPHRKFPHLPRGDNFNSHMPLRAHYAEMLHRYKSTHKPAETGNPFMTVEQIKEVLGT